MDPGKKLTLAKVHKIMKLNKEYYFMRKIVKIVEVVK